MLGEGGDQCVLCRIPSRDVTSKIIIINARDSSLLLELNRSISNRRVGIFMLLSRPGIDSKELIPPANEAWRTSTTTVFLLGS